MANRGCQLDTPGKVEPQKRKHLSQFPCGYIYGVFSALPVDMRGPTPDSWCQPLDR